MKIIDKQGRLVETLGALQVKPVPSVTPLAVDGLTVIARDNSNSTVNATDCHLLLSNDDSGGAHTFLVFTIEGGVAGGIRADYVGNLNWHTVGSQGHQFYNSLDPSVPIVGFSGNGLVIGGDAGATSTARLDVLSKATNNIGLIIKRYSSGQTANLLEARDESNAVLAGIKAGGAIVGRKVITPKASNYNITTAESRSVFTNEGASGGVTFNLPSAMAGLSYVFLIQVAQTVTIAAASGDTVRIANAVSASAGNASASAPGNVVTFTAINATEWIAESSVGSWTVT